MQPMEIQGTSVPEKDGMTKVCTRNRFLALMGIVAVGIFTFVFVSPDGEFMDEESSSIIERKKKELVPKVKAGERYPYTPDHWCLNDKVLQDFQKKKCESQCENPLAPRVQMHYMSDWLDTHNKFIEIVKDAPSDLDVVFYGDQMIEGFLGTHIGNEDESLAEGRDIFKSYFSKENGAEYEGLALGIADDRTSHLLYRLQSGELPDNLTPKVFWLQIGTNNFRTELCSEETVARGITRVAEELMEKRPESKIVINGLLPRADHTLTGKLHGNVSLNGEILLTIWDGIQMVNELLKAFAEEHENVYYVDSTSLFVDVDGDDEEIPENLMKNYKDLTLEGYVAWEESIVEKLHEIIPIKE